MIWTVPPMLICGALLLFTAGCTSEPEKENPPAEQDMLDKLDSKDPDKFLEGVDEAGKKYGKKP
jgi:hypothetical protein